MSDHKSDPKRLTGPIVFINRLIDTWNLKESDATFLLGYEKTDHDYVSELLSGRKKLIGRDIKDRIAYLIIIRITLSSLIRDEVAENLWLRDSQVELNNTSPMKLMLSGTMKNLLIVKNFIDVIAGR